jgi:hypothetical protein
MEEFRVDEIFKRTAMHPKDSFFSTPVVKTLPSFVEEHVKKKESKRSLLDLFQEALVVKTELVDG